jgi:hypothetical protein
MKEFLISAAIFCGGFLACAMTVSIYFLRFVANLDKELEANADDPWHTPKEGATSAASCSACAMDVHRCEACVGNSQFTPAEAPHA